MSHVKLFNHYIPSPLIVLGGLEAALLFVSLLVGNSIRFGWLESGVLIIDASLLSSAALYALVMAACTSAMGVYSAGLRDGNGAMAVRTLVAYCLLGCAALTMIYYLLPPFYMGRGVLAYAIVVSFMLVLPVRWLFLRWVDAETLRPRILVLGVGERASRFATDLDASHSGVANIVAFVETSHTSERMVSDRVIGYDRNLLDLVKKYNANEIVVALDDRRAGPDVLPLDQLFECRMHGIKVNESISVTERELGKIVLEDIRPGWLVYAPGFYSSSLWCGVKRCCDILIAILIFLVAWPFMLVVVLMIMLETGRPVIYRQVRVGLEGKHFEIFKFRSMTVDAEKDGKAVWAGANDSRVTRVGAFIRNTRLDELPQLFNVIRGDMSIVGPRPERPEFVEGLVDELPYYNERHHARPGLMGWAQLNYPYGASVEDSANKLRFDLYYIKNRSLLLDIIIMVQTVQVILLGTGVR